MRAPLHKRQLICSIDLSINIFSIATNNEKNNRQKFLCNSCFELDYQLTIEAFHY